MPASPTIPTTRPRPLAARASSPSSTSSSRCRPTNVASRLRWSSVARGRWTRRNAWRPPDRRSATSTNFRESSGRTDSATITVLGSASTSRASMSVMRCRRTSASMRVPSGSTARGTLATWSAAWTPTGGPSSCLALTVASAAWAARSATSPVGVVPNDASSVRGAWLSSRPPNARTVSAIRSSRPALVEAGHASSATSRTRSSAMCRRSQRGTGMRAPPLSADEGAETSLTRDSPRRRMR